MLSKLLSTAYACCTVGQVQALSLVHAKTAVPGALEVDEALKISTAGGSHCSPTR